MSLLDLNNLEELVESLVLQSIKETYGPVNVESDEEENRKQNLVSDEIENLKLRAPQNPKSNKEEEEEMDEEEKVSLKVSNEEEEKDSNVEFTKKLPEVIEVEQIIDILNLIRSGPSLKDKGLLERFSNYFTALSAPEKVALFGFLNGISQVIVGGVSGTEAQTPEKAPFNVDMQSTSKKDTGLTSKNKIEKSPVAKAKNVQTPSGTETPIIVGEVADKTLILNKLREML